MSKEASVSPRTDEVGEKYIFKVDRPDGPVTLPTSVECPSAHTLEPIPKEEHFGSLTFSWGINERERSGYKTGGSQRIFAK
jgi:hypothetical protein